MHFNLDDFDLTDTLCGKTNELRMGIPTGTEYLFYVGCGLKRR